MTSHDIHDTCFPLLPSARSRAAEWPPSVTHVLCWLAVFLNPDSANDHCLILFVVVMSCSSHYKEYQETVAPGEMRKRPCLSWAELILVIITQPCTWRPLTCQVHTLWYPPQPHTHIQATCNIIRQMKIATTKQLKAINLFNFKEVNGNSFLMFKIQIQTYKTVYSMIYYSISYNA